ncbi:hypothetical protein OIU77_027141 [Salix suchowensis]|uniref:Uncharacterized protein n=1 Tax=Salix suchowensis TaxID=1278906 RepID=A0ABQ9BNS3_9ROSI|nr:hypothetical protein OIU77_027141 [Salix suchowensis]
MPFEMESMADAIGVSVPVLRFLLCFVVTIPVSFIHRFVPSSFGKHFYSAISGAFLSYLSFGFSSNLHFLVPMLLGYLSMVLFRPFCGILTFLFGFGYLIGCHMYYMSGDAWKEGGIDATGALMVLTLKVISCAMNYNDGLLKEDDHFAGPVYEMKDYLEWTTRKGIWAPSEKGPSPSPFGATIRALFQAAVCMALYLYLIPRYNIPGLNGIIVSGLGLSGWTETSPPRPQWDRARNVDILGVEFAKSAVQLPLVWNIQVSTWLRHYVYDRLVQKGKKPGFFQLLATQTTSAVWHGLYPGYIIFFVQSALMIAGSRVLYRWQQAIPPNMALVKKLLVFTNIAYTILVLNYSAVGFMVLSLQETIALYGSVYYVGSSCTGSIDPPWQHN